MRKKPDPGPAFLRLAFSLGDDARLLPGEVDQLACDNLCALARFDRAVDLNLPLGNQVFGLGAAVAPALQLQQIAQLDVRMIVQMESLHGLFSCLKN